MDGDLVLVWKAWETGETSQNCQQQWLKGRERDWTAGQVKGRGSWSESYRPSPQEKMEDAWKMNLRPESGRSNWLDPVT